MLELLKRWRWVITLGLVLVTALALACEDEEEGPTATATPSPSPTAAGSVEIVAPIEGDTVSSPATLEVNASGITIAPAADAVEGAAHFHAFVDVDPVAEGAAIPQDTAGIFHFATNALELELEPGEHTVTVVLGSNSHIRLAGVDPATVTFTVQ